MSKRTWIIVIIIALVVAGILYIKFFLSPGRIDFFLRWAAYNQIADTFLTDEYKGILSVDKKRIIFDDTTECFSKEKYWSPPCDEKYNKLFEWLNYSGLESYSWGGNSMLLHHLGFYWRLYQYDYAYNKLWFSEQDKKSIKVKEVINDHWIIYYY